MRYLTGIFVTVLMVLPAAAQEQSASSNSLRVFLDCQYFCDNQFIKDELPIVDFLNESTQADVHILHARQSTAAGGSRITLTFLGQRGYSAMSDTLMFSTNADASNDEERQALVHHLAIGLSRYLARAGLSDKLVIRAVRPSLMEAPTSSIESDPWDYWVFSISANGSMNGEKQFKSTRRRASFSANRTTEALKLRLSGNLSESITKFLIDPDPVHPQWLRSTTSSSSLYATAVASIGTQWAFGGTGSVSKSSYENAKLRMEIGPAIEYDFFPYSESTRKFLTLQYAIRLAQNYYDELTIFALEEETILRHSLELSLSLSQKWGSASLSADLNHLLTNFDRSLTDSYNLGLFGSASVRLFRGLSFNTFASYNLIRDQLDLPAEEASKEEILLRSVKLSTGYEYMINFGFTYRFGSIFNNVVNPRMGGGGGGGMIIMM